LNIAALLTGKKTEDETVFATVQVPSVLPRLVQIPSEGETKSFILLEQIIERNIGILFSNYKVLCAYPYRIMRNADLTIDEDEASDLLKEIENKLKMRQWGEVIRLEIEEKVDKKLLKFLKTELKVSDEDIFQIAGPIDLTFLMKMYGIDGYDHLRYKPYTPQQVPEITPGISADTIQCLFNRQDIRIFGCLPDEIHNRIKGFVWMMQKNIPFADCGQKI
jgi:polyphosphate kinase